jgi:hypothetical protein
MASVSHQRKEFEKKLTDVSNDSNFQIAATRLVHALHKMLVALMLLLATEAM